MKTGSEYIKHQIKAHKISQIKLARRCGWHHTMVTHLKNGDLQVTPWQAALLEVASDGVIKAERSAPDYFSFLEKLGFRRVLHNSSLSNSYTNHTPRQINEQVMEATP